MWRRVHPERAETVQAELEDSRAEVLIARQVGDEEIEQALVGEWQVELEVPEADLQPLTSAAERSSIRSLLVQPAGIRVLTERSESILAFGVTDSQVW